MSDNTDLKPLRVRFVLPPAPLRLGGLDMAIDGLAGALSESVSNDRVQVVVAEEDCDLEDDIDLVHIHGLWRPRSRAIAAAATARKIPYLVSPHGMLEPWARNNKWLKKTIYWGLFEGALMRGAAAILTTSEMESRHIAEDQPTLKSLLHDIPLGIDPPPDSGSETQANARQALDISVDETVLLYLSRVDRKKGLDLLVDALAIAPSGVDRLIVVGDGDEAFKAKIEAQIRIYSSAPDYPEIDWVGAVWGDEKWRYLVASDAFCLPTYSENFGFAVLEALLVGVPTITTTETPWAAEEGLDGLTICEPETESLVEGLGACGGLRGVWSPPQRARLSNWATDRFLWANLAGRYETFYREIAAR